MRKLIYTTLFLAPVLTMAQNTIVSNQTGNLAAFLKLLAGYINLAMPVVIGIALLVFLWGVLQFIFAADNDEAREKGKSKMIYGIIGLFVMVAVWGLVQFVASTLGISLGGNVTGSNIPSVSVPGATSL